MPTSNTLPAFYNNFFRVEDTNSITCINTKLKQLKKKQKFDEQRIKEDFQLNAKNKKMNE